MASAAKVLHDSKPHYDSKQKSNPNQIADGVDFESDTRKSNSMSKIDHRYRYQLADFFFGSS